VLLYILRRILLAISVVFATMIVSFLLFFAGPGDPALNICGDAKCSPQRVEDIRTSFHLDEPVSKQFADYALGVVRGREIISGGFVKPCPAPCLGYSFKTDQPVVSILISKIPVDAIDPARRLPHLPADRHPDRCVRSKPTRHRG
jgi:peptide/nickel transport system permease protein